MSNPFFDHPILNSPYECMRRHWELDAQGQRAQRIDSDFKAKAGSEFNKMIPGAAN